MTDRPSADPRSPDRLSPGRSSLDLCAIGLGQGGGNLAAEWRRRGYRALFLNTAHADLRSLSRLEAARHDGGRADGGRADGGRGLDVPERLQVYIGMDGAEGAGKDPAFGRASVRDHADEIREAVERHLDGADALLLCGGLGGGTGSSLDELARVLAPLQVPLLTCATLPSDSESGIAKVNAVKAVNALVTADLAGRVFIDNARLVGAFPGLDLVGYYPKVNARVLAPLDEINRLNAREDLWSIRSFDAEDLRKLLLSGGVLQTYVGKLQDKALTAEDIVDVVARCVDGGELLAPGLSLEQTAYLAVVIAGPEKALRATSMQAFDEAARELKKRTAGGAVYEGLYVGPDDAPLRAYVLASSLAMPKRISTLLGEAQREGEALAKKIQAEIPELSISPLEGLELFRAPARRKKREERGAPARPRPVAAQVAADVDGLDRDDDVVDAKGPEHRLQTEPSAIVSIPPAERPGADKGSEPTILVDEDLLAGREAAKAAPRRDPDMVPRVGTGRWAEGAPDREMTATAVVDENGKARLVEAMDRDEPFADTKNLPRRTSGAPAEGSQIHFHPPIAASDEEQEPSVTSPTTPNLPPVKQPSPDRPPTLARAGERTWIGGSEADEVLRSVGSGGSVAELQGVYEDLIDRFRQAPDRRGRERVARRLIDDSRAEDVEVRALAVWAMVKLGEPGFRRALAKAANDQNPEISKLALTGLERLGALNEPAT